MGSLQFRSSLVGLLRMDGLGKRMRLEAGEETGSFCSSLVGCLREKGSVWNLVRGGF